MLTETGVQGLFGYKLKKTQHALRLAMDDALISIDLTTPQYSVLAQLELHPGISNASLARASFISPQTMHKIVSNLEQRNLIERKKNSFNNKILCTELTEKGQELVKNAHFVIKAIELRMLSTIGKDRRCVFEKLLLECFNNLQ